MLKIEYSPKFTRVYKKLPKQVKDKAEEKEKLFRKNPFDPKLKTHKLTGRLKKYWAFSVGYQCRIVFSLISKNKVRFHTIGSHSIYKKFIGIL